MAYEIKFYPTTPVRPRMQPIRRKSPRVSRNSPCPCGSGKKHKKCCGTGE